MTDNAYAKSVLAHVAMDFVPQLIRETLLGDSQFRDEYGLTMDGVLSFGDSKVSVQQSDFFNAVRHVLSDLSEYEVTDTKGHRWKLRNIGAEGELPSLSLSCCTNPLPTYLIALSPNRDVRLRSLDQDISDFNLPTDASDHWRNTLSSRALGDEEVEDFRNHFRDTPVAIAQAIRTDIWGGQSTVSSLVPSSRRYFERLVGVYDGSTSILDYASGTGRELIQQLVSWRPYDGFLTSLYLSSHASLTDEIVVDKMSSKELVNAYGLLVKHGDRMSQLGAIEVGLRILPSNPEIEQALIHLIEQIRDDDVGGKTSGFKLLSTLFCLVDGELSGIRLYSKEPPFFRRLAALSHASLVHRQLVNSSADINDFTNWALENCRGFYLQSLADMRREPRWDPDLVLASQIKANFLGRIMFAAKKNEANIASSPVLQLLFAKDAGSVQSLSDSFYNMLPGPLEGAESAEFTVPRDVANAIETQLNAKEVGISSFFALVNCARIYNISTDQAQLAADALKRANYWIQDIDNKQELVAILNGLATAAAVTRSTKLADELRVLVRKYRRDSQFRLSIPEVVKLCVSAAASRSDPTEWTEFVGEWLTELAFGDLEKEEAEVLQTSLDWLSQIVPELWVTCGRADAALEAFSAN